MIRPVLLHPECVEAGGDVVVGLLLSQVVYWHTPDKNGHDRQVSDCHGVYWIAMAREQWMAETGLTLEQYKRAITVLKRKGWVQTRVMRFQGDAITHLRLLQPIAGGVLPPRVKVSPPTGWSQTLQPVGGKPTTPVQIVQTVLGIEKKKEDPVCIGETQISFASTQGTLSSSNTIEGKQEQDQNLVVKGTQVVKPLKELYSGFVNCAKPNHPWWCMKAKDILAAHQGALNGELGAYWLSRVKLVTEDPKAYLPPLTVKQRGQLSHLKKKLGEMTKPVIAYAVQHWMTFASHAADYAGWSDYPTNPDIGFLLKHHHVAVNLLLPKTPKPKATPAMVTVQSVAPVAVKEPAHKITSKELAEILDWLNEP